MKISLCYSLTYHVVLRQLVQACDNENEYEIKLLCEYPLQIRVDRLLSVQLGVSRSRIKKLYQEGLLYSTGITNLLKTKVYNGMVINLKKNY